MPPPTAPASKPTDPTDLADALTSAGIDLKEEEARLAQSSSGAGFGGSYNVDPHTGLPASLDDAQKAEQRRRVILRANHLNDPFLEPRALTSRLASKTRAENCAEFVAPDATAPPATTAAAAVAASQSTDIVTLLSLACRERLNTLLNRSSALAKVRRRPQSTISGEWADYIEGVTPEIRQESIGAVSPKGGSLKRESLS